MENTTIEALVQLLFNLSVAVPGMAALVVVVVNILKMFKVVTDGNAPFFVNVLNIGFAVVIGVLALFFPAVNIPGLDETFGSLAGMLTAFLPLLAILVKWLAPLFYKAIRGFPVLGFHYKK